MFRKGFPRFSLLVVLALFSLILLAACGDIIPTNVLPTQTNFLSSPSASSGSPGSTTPSGSQTPPPVTLTCQIKIGVLVTLSGSNSAYGIAIKNGFDLAGSETYTPGENDFRTQLNKLKAAQPDLLIVSGLVGEAAPLVQQAREVGITGSILGGNGFNTSAFTTQAKDAAEGVIIGSAWFSGIDNPKSQAFVMAYKPKFNVEPDQYAAQAYTGVYLLVNAVRNANSTAPKAVRDALAQLKNLDSVLGTYSFDANRNPVHDPVVVTVKGGKFVLYQ